MATATARALGGLLHDLTEDELLALTASDNRPALKEFLAGLIAKMWHAISYDQSVGLVSLIKAAVGERNHANINPNITQDHFPLKGTGIRKVNGRVEAYLDGETPEQTAKRLTDAGHILGSTGDLAGFLHDHPDEVEKWAWVLAKGFLQERLHLQLHPKKVTINTFASGVDFLGWVHFTDHRVLRGTTKRRMMRRLKECEKEETLRSYLGLLSHGNTMKLREEVLREYWVGKK